MEIYFRSSWVIAGVLAAAAISIMPAIGEDAVAAQELSYGVSDVLQLSKAKVGEDTIVSYVQSSGNSYGGMNASEIVYLHQEGVSDRVVSTMLDQRNRITPAAQDQAQSTAAATPEVSAAIVQSQPAYVQPSVTYVRPAPVSTVYIMRDSSPRLVDYGIYPRYSYYGGYYYGYTPSVSFSFGFGGGYHRTSYHGGSFHGGGYHGGFHGHH